MAFVYLGIHPEGARKIIKLSISATAAILKI
jgi:hypothetical protein